MTILLTRRTTLLAAGALAITPSALFAQGEAGPAIGQAAPDFALPDENGAIRRLSEFRGRTVVLEWTNHDCPFVRKHYNSGNMQALQKLARDKGVVWLSMASSPVGEQGHVTAGQAKELTVSRDAAPTAVILDPNSQASRAYRAVVTPHMFVISGDGVLRYMGAIDSIRSSRVEDVAKAEPLLRNAMLAVAEGRPVAQAVTQPYGCAVKYAPAA